MVLRNYPLKIVPLISLSLSSGISLVAFGQFHHGVVDASHGRPLLFQCKMHDICQPLQHFFLKLFIILYVSFHYCLHLVFDQIFKQMGCFTGEMN